MGVPPWLRKIYSGDSVTIHEDRCSISRINRNGENIGWGVNLQEHKKTLTQNYWDDLWNYKMATHWFAHWDILIWYAWTIKLWLIPPPKDYTSPETMAKNRKFTHVWDHKMGVFCMNRGWTKTNKPFILLIYPNRPKETTWLCLRIQGYTPRKLMGSFLSSSSSWLCLKISGKTSKSTGVSFSLSKLPFWVYPSEKYESQLGWLATQHMGK